MNTLETRTEETKKDYYTTYDVAVNWLDNDFVLCNNIPEVDESIYDNMRFNYYDEETDTYAEIYQWYITDCTESDVEYLEKYFELKFTYSNKLDCFILCVDHLGTSWKYVSNIVRDVDEYTPLCKTYKELTGYEY